MRLNQLLAIEKGLKTQAEQQLTALYHKLQKPALLAGITKHYRARNEEEQELPPPDEEQPVQVRAEETLQQVSAALLPLWNATLAKETANGSAAAEVVVGGKVLLDAHTPVTYLLFLEKQLVGLATYVDKLPTLDPAQTWEWDASSATYVTPARTTIRTKKVPRILVKAAATDKHPAQVDTWQEDVGVGTWEQKQFSGAIPESRRRQLMGRVEALQQAVKQAREQANMAEVKETTAAKAVFDFLFASQ